MAGPGPRRRHVAVARLDGAAAPATVDLHAHTQRSDGLLEPVALVAAAATAGIRLFALTDHDTLAGYREVVRAGAVPPGLELVPGVEINASVSGRVGAPGGELHLVGLGVDPDHEPLEAVLAGQRDGRRVRFERMLARLRELDLPVDDVIESEGLVRPDQIDSLGRPTIARALIAKGHATSVEDAFERLLSRGRPAHVPRAGLDPIAAIRAIRAAGGLATLAHYPDAPAQVGAVRELMAEGLDGLEVYYRTFDRETATAMADFAAREGLVATGGTDYHGDLGPYADAHAGLWFPEAAGDAVRRAIGRTRAEAFG